MQDYKSKLIDSSRILADILCADISNDPERFIEMFQLCMKDEYPLSMRAARILAMCVSNHPYLVLPHSTEILNFIEKTKVEGVKRSFLRIFAEVPVPLDDISQGKLIDLCFSQIGDPNEAIAIRNYSIDIVLKSIRQFPELTSELSYLLEEMAHDNSVGLRTKSKKTLKKLRDK